MSGVCLVLSDPSEGVSNQEGHQSVLLVRNASQTAEYMPDFGNYI